MNNSEKLGFMERFSILAIVGYLSYFFVISIQTTFSHYSYFQKLVLIILWYFVTLGISRLVRKLLIKILHY